MSMKFLVTLLIAIWAISLMSMLYVFEPAISPLIESIRAKFGESSGLVIAGAMGLSWLGAFSIAYLISRRLVNG